MSPVPARAARAYIEIYKDKAGGWRWRIVSPNGRIIADSAESYTRRWSAQRAADRVLGADVQEHTPPQKGSKSPAASEPQRGHS